MYKILQALSGIYFFLKSFFDYLRKDELKKSKDDALKNGDQREFEDKLSDLPVDNNLPIDKYNGMYERATKKES